MIAKAGSHRLSQLCAFCGQKPKEKTKEHILPLWLIKAAGKPGETVYLGQHRKTGREFRFPFERLTLPACSACNNSYAVLEASTKPVLQKLFEEQSITVAELTILLDWFDKVRLGLWLWGLAMNGTPMERRFHISQRVGRKDRLLFMAYYDGKPRGTALVGHGTLAFEVAPCCLGLAINNIAFISVSFDFLIARQLGLPYLKNWRLQGDGEPELAEYVAGTGQTSAALVPGRFRFPGFLCGQSIFSQAVNEPHIWDLYQTSIHHAVMEPRSDRSHLMLQSGGKLMPLAKDASFSPSVIAGAKAKTLRTWFPLEVVRMQQEIQSRMPSYRWQEPQRWRDIEAGIRETNEELELQAWILERQHRSEGGLIL